MWFRMVTGFLGMASMLLPELRVLLMLEEYVFHAVPMIRSKISWNWAMIIWVNMRSKTSKNRCECTRSSWNLTCQNLWLMNRLSCLINHPLPSCRLWTWAVIPVRNISVMGSPNRLSMDCARSQTYLWSPATHPLLTKENQSMYSRLEKNWVCDISLKAVCRRQETVWG